MTAAGRPLEALHATTFGVATGRRVAVVGRSGSGKSTLLHLAAGIDTPTEGSVLLDGRDIGRMTDRERAQTRRDDIGLVFQFFHLLKHLSVRENVALPHLIAGGSAGGTRSRVDALLDRVGLLDRADDEIEGLSGGEMQRVAICRAVLRRPKLVLADEPTGNLDDEHGRAVMDLLFDLVGAERGSLVYVTHSHEFAELADDVWTLHDGRLTVS